MTMPHSRRNFCVIIHRAEYEKICEWTLLKKNIETGGDLFGLWCDSYTPVVQLVLGPGRNVRRTPISFYQDSEYLEQVGSYLTQNEGLCHIGEWHSHHQLGLDRPSGGDELTVWRNMPQYGLKRFFIFITNIYSSFSSQVVQINCFLFEIDPETKTNFPVVQGELKVLDGKSVLRVNPTIRHILSPGAEDKIHIEHYDIIPKQNLIMAAPLSRNTDREFHSSNSDNNSKYSFIEDEYVMISIEDADNAENMNDTKREYSDHSSDSDSGDKGVLYIDEYIILSMDDADDIGANRIMTTKEAISDMHRPQFFDDDRKYLCMEDEYDILSVEDCR